MPIQVTCPGCRTRFRVSDEHAGKQGSCPKCGEAIKVPSQEEEVVIHAPEHSERGALDSQGRPVLKPVAWTDAKFHPAIFGAVLGVAIVAFAVALIFRGESPNPVLLTIGAILLGPPLAWAGYSFLRDAEFEGYSGSSLWIRSLACGLVYALLWGVYAFVYQRLWGDAAPETWQLLLLGPALFGVGTFAAYVCFDLEPSNGFFHYGLYVAMTVLLRMTMGLSPV